MKFISSFFVFLKSIAVSIKEAIFANQEIKKKVNAHPNFFGFLRNRFDKNKFSGLPLTLLGIAFIYALSLFFGVIEDIVTTDQIVMADKRVENLLLVFRNARLNKIFLWITLLGNAKIVASSAVVATIIFLLWKKKNYLLPLWVAIIGSGIFGFISKLAFHRQRPESAFYIEDSFSFPSGHATIAVAFYGFITYILFRNLKKFGNKISALFIGIIIILSIGFSRLYLGVHFLSDVWGGYLLGLLWLIIGISILEWLQYRKSAPLFNPTRKNKIISIFLIIAELIFYINFASRWNPLLNAREETSNEIITADILGEFNNKKLTRFTETIIGENQEPLNFIIIAANDSSLINIMESAGWHLADNPTFYSVAKLAKAAFLNRNYLAAPMTPSFWNAKAHNFGFEKSTTAQNVRERHHARFWRTQLKTLDGANVYVGTASLDIGIKWFITQKIKPDIDTEREFLFSDLENTGLISNFQKEKFVEPTFGKNFSGDQFFTDGEIYLIIFK